MGSFLALFWPRPPSDFLLLISTHYSITPSVNGKLSKMEIIELTVTTGSGDSVGVAGVSKSMYPTAKAIIPLGYDATLGYRVGCFKVSTDHIFFAIQDAVKGSWANAKTITFKALLI